MNEEKLKTLKICEICGKEIPKDPKLSNKQYENKRYCSVKCRQKGRSRDMKGKQLMDENPNWKGDNATNNTTFHKRVEELFGKPRICVICETTDKNKTYDWACLTGKYEDINDYKRLCRSCHKKYDLARLGKGLVTLKDLPLEKRNKEILSSMAVKWVKKDFEDWNSISKDVLLKRWMKRLDISEEDLEDEMS